MKLIKVDVNQEILTIEWTKTAAGLGWKVKIFSSQTLLKTSKIPSSLFENTHEYVDHFLKTSEPWKSEKYVCDVCTADHRRVSSAKEILPVKQFSIARFTLCCHYLFLLIHGSIPHVLWINKPWNTELTRSFMCAREKWIEMIQMQMNENKQKSLPAFLGSRSMRWKNQTTELPSMSPSDSYWLITLRHQIEHNWCFFGVKNKRKLMSRNL